MVQRVEVSCNPKEGLHIMEFSYRDANNHDAGLYLSERLSGSNAVNYLNNLARTHKISKRMNFNDWYEEITYDDGRVVKLNNVEDLRRLGYVDFYLEHVKAYERARKAALAPRVTRKNKYTGRKVVAYGLALLSLIFVVSYFSKNVDVDIPEEVPIVSVETTSPNVITTGFGGIVITPESTQKTEITTMTPLPSKPSTPETEESVVVEDDFVYVEYELRSEYAMTKYYNAKSLYGDMIYKYANMYGLDPELVLGLATHERGVHSSDRDPGGATGLMQIQNGVWEDEYVTAYNFETKSYEKVHITKEKMSDCETNIKLGCMILQDMLRLNDYNILMGIQSYNYGTSGVKTAVNAYVNEVGGTVSDVRSDHSDTGWLEYRDVVKHGDSKYLEHIFSYIGEDIELKFYKPDGTLVVCNVQNYTNTRTR